MRKVFVILLFTISLTSYSTTYYIDPAGKDATTNNGSKTAPWKSLYYACSKVKTSGDIIHVNQGTYLETTQSTLSAGVSIEGEGIGSKITSNISKLYTFTILLTSTTSAADGRQHISGLYMDGSSMTAYGAIRVAYRKNVEIYNCTFKDFLYYGVSFINGEPPDVYATGNKFHDNTVTNCSGYFSGNMGALEIQGQDGMLIYNNNMSQTRPNGLNGDIIYGVEGFLKNVKIYNNVLNKTYVPGTTHWDFAIELWNCLGGVEIYDNTITGSVDLVYSKAASPYCVWIHDNIIGQPALGPSESTRGILLEANEENIIIERNQIKNVASGIFIDQFGSARTVANININSNIFNNIGVSSAGDDSKGWGIIFTDEDYKNHTVNNVSICNNVIIGQSGSRSTMWGINLPHIGTATNIIVRNNIIRDFDYAPVYAYTQTGRETINTLSIENNIFYLNGNSNTPRYSGITPTNNTTRNNLTSNPLFLSATDFHLQSGSPAIGKGLKITGVTNDLDGNLFGDPPSIGAYEFYVLAIPVYQSSVVENVTPSVLEMTYNFSLASISPAPSAFAVMVNAAARTVNSVAISGNKVKLTLASPILFGDAVTVSYTAPATNFLQSASGGVAVSISAKSVTNNCVSTTPVYSSSVIENLTPSLLEMTYTLTFANVVPAPAAFTVMVNSVARTVSAVAVSGTKVRLTLSSAAKYGDVVTVAYTKPATNPLQSSTGSQSATITAKAVTNNIKDPVKPNDPPVVVITNDAQSFSGFVGQIDASGTTDANNDALSYQWTAPANVSISSTSGSKINFLAPIVSSSKTIQFTLKVSDGLITVTKTASVNILPYKPELANARVSNVDASNYEGTNYPQNVLDGNFNTNWAMSGDNQWLLLELSEPFNISHLDVAFLKGQRYSSSFDIYASGDNQVWEPVLINKTSCNFSGDDQVFVFPAGLTKTEYSFIKFIGHGNSQGDLNNISEFRISGTPVTDPGGGTPQGSVVIYPNPALDYFNISLDEPALYPDTVRLIDLTGKVILVDTFDPGLITVQLPANIKSGIYIVELLSGITTMFAQKLIVKK
jgi:uncharacterized repeat protein (TIGR02059 family)